MRLMLAVMLIASSTIAWSQQPEQAGPDRDKFIEQLRPYQHEFLTKELKLSREQARDFLPLYDKLDDELRRIADETRELERQTLDNASASDTELEAASAAVFAQKEKEGKLEMEYYDKFRAILSPRQLLQLKGAERQWAQRLLRQHRQIKRNDHARTHAR